MRERAREPDEPELRRDHVRRGPRAGVPRHAADVDDGAGAARAQRRQGRLRAMEGAVEDDAGARASRSAKSMSSIDVTSRTAALFTRMSRRPKRCVTAAPSRPPGLVGHVGQHQGASPPRRLDLLHDRVRLVPACAHVHHDRAPRIGQRQRDRRGRCCGRPRSPAPRALQLAASWASSSGPLAARVERHARAKRRPRERQRSPRSRRPSRRTRSWRGTSPRCRRARAARGARRAGAAGAPRARAPSAASRARARCTRPDRDWPGRSRSSPSRRAANGADRARLLLGEGLEAHVAAQHARRRRRTEC